VYTGCAKNYERWLAVEYSHYKNKQAYFFSSPYSLQMPASTRCNSGVGIFNTVCTVQILVVGLWNLWSSVEVFQLIMRHRGMVCYWNWSRH